MNKKIALLCLLATFLLAIGLCYAEAPAYTLPDIGFSAYTAANDEAYFLDPEGILAVRLDDRSARWAATSLQCAEAGLICDSPYRTITWLQGGDEPLLCDWTAGKVFAVRDQRVELKAAFTPFEEEYDHLVAGAYTGEAIYAAVCGKDDLTYEHRVYRVPLDGGQAQCMDWQRIDTLVPLSDGRLVLQQVGYHQEDLDDFTFLLYDEKTQQMEKAAVLNGVLAWGLASTGENFCIVQDDLLMQWKDGAWVQLAQLEPRGEQWLMASAGKAYYTLVNVLEKKLMVYAVP